MPLSSELPVQDSLTHFYHLLDRFLEQAWGKDWGVFVPAYPKDLELSRVPRLPIITSRVIAKIPGLAGRAGIREIKPRVREIMPFEDGEVYTIFGQRFEYRIRFAFWNEDLQKSWEDLTRFEETMMVYSGMIKGAGVIEILPERARQQSTEEANRFHTDLVASDYDYILVMEKILAMRSTRLRELREQVQRIVTDLDSALLFYQTESGN